jgi:hypothetical protein
MKTLIGRFASIDAANQAQAALINAYPTGNPRLSLSNRVSVVTALSMVVGAVLGYLSANGMVANWGITLDGGKTYLGLLSSDPQTLFGYTVLGLALGIPVGLVLGVLATLLPQGGAQPFRLAALTHHGQTLIIQTDNRHADGIAQNLRASGASTVQMMAGRIDPMQVSAALDQLSRQA